MTVDQSDLVPTKQKPLVEVLQNDREYLLLQGVIAGLKNGNYYDKGDLAKVLEKYNTWVWDILSRTLALAEQAEFNAFIKDNKYKDLCAWMKADGCWKRLVEESREVDQLIKNNK